MTQYDKLYDLPVIMPPESLDNILANVLAATICAICAWPKRKSSPT